MRCNMKKITIIGGCNIDYCAYTFDKINIKDSNPCRIIKSFGGVGRNICDNLTREQVKCNFFTIIGKNDEGQEIKKELESRGVKFYSPDTNLESGKYFAIIDDQKDMAIAACDETIMDDFNIEFINEHQDIINDSSLIVLDANLNQQLIDDLFEKYSHKKIIVEGVSETKILKFINHLNKIYLLKANLQEYKSVLKYTDNIHEVKHLIISNGSENVIHMFNHQKEEIIVPSLEKIENASGAGDALMSGIIYGIYHSYDIVKAIETGIKWAGLTCSVKNAVYDKRIEN